VNEPAQTVLCTTTAYSRPVTFWTSLGAFKILGNSNILAAFISTVFASEIVCNQVHYSYYYGLEINTGWRVRKETSHNF
jgi:hypothetical protein